MTSEDQIKKMVDRFLTWRLPEDFSPDGGISFDPISGWLGPHPSKREPVGTNLLNAVQAEAMVRHMVENMAGAEPLPKDTSRFKKLSNVDDDVCEDMRCDYCKEHRFQAPNLCEDCRENGINEIRPAPIAWQWRALEDGEPRTDWKDPEIGDRAGWEALAKRNPEKYATERRDLVLAKRADEGSRQRDCVS